MATTRRPATRRTRRSRSHGLTWLSGRPRPSFFQFLGSHWKVILIPVIIIAFLFIAKGISGLLGGGTKAPGKTGIVKLDSYKIGVFDTEEEAITYSITDFPAGPHTIEVNGKNPVISVDWRWLSLLGQTAENEWAFDLTNVGNNETVIVTVKTGGDGSLVGQLLSNDVSTSYFAVTVKNDTPAGNGATGGSATAQSGLPTGKLLINGAEVTVFSDDISADNAATQLSTSLESIPISAEPSENTARIFVKVCKVDSTPANYGEIYLVPSNNWSSYMNLSELAGHRVTIVARFGDTKASNSTSQFISFFLPISNQ